VFPAATWNLHHTDMAENSIKNSAHKDKSMIRTSTILHILDFKWVGMAILKPAKLADMNSFMHTNRLKMGVTAQNGHDMSGHGSQRSRTLINNTSF